MISKSENWSKESSPKLQQENSNPQDGGASPESSPNSQEQSMVLSRLFDASKYASDCGKNNWDFAIELSDFVQQGVSRSLLRWLVYRRYVEHRYEVRTRDGEGRLFREAPDSVLTDSSCFTIAEGGREALGRLRQDGLSKSSDESKPNAVLPVWCPVTRILKISGKVVKHFKWPAPNQEKLICAFAEQGWPVRLDDPLPPNGVCPKRRLHDTIKCLNRNQVNKLIKFRGDGTGQGARWEYRPQESEEK